MQSLVKITDLRVHVCQADGSWLWLPVSESPYYKALKAGDMDSFYEYHGYLLNSLGQERLDAEIDWEAFNDLRWKIDVFGFKFEDPAITVKKKTLNVLDGQHRLSILLLKYGEDLALEITENKVVGLWVKLNV